MALRLSTGLRNALLSGTNGGFRELMTNGWLDIYSGAQPASADYTETGTKLVRISSTSGQAATDGCKFSTAAAAGVLGISTPVWSGAVQVAGVAGWFRFYGSSGTGGATGTSGTAHRFDGACGLSGADLVLTHTTLAADSTLTVTAANITQPAE
jgi:hypothetical protein